MKFFKANSYDIVRLYINQIGIAIFSLVVYTATGLVDFKDPSMALTVKGLVSLGSLIFYFSLIYNVCWECGAKDKIRVDGGKSSATPAKGALMSLFANLPNAFLALMTLIFLGVYAFFERGAAFAIFNLFMRFHQSLYLGLIQWLTAALRSESNLDFLVETILYFVLPFISVLICHFGYMLGRKDKKLFSLNEKNTQN
jgi:hypothetical protein